MLYSLSKKLSSLSLSLTKLSINFSLGNGMKGSVISVIYKIEGS